MFEWVHPERLWALVALLPLLVWWVVRARHAHGRVRWSGVDPVGLSWRSAVKPWLPLLRFAGLALLIVALARPRKADVSTQTRGIEGIDIILAVDLSASMLARDLKPNRLEALKKVAGDFVAGRPSDRIGLVAYAGEAFTKVPLTIDHRILQQSIVEMEYGDLEDGTAIGMGLATAVNRLAESEAKSRVIILMTDGENNRGMIDPMTAAQLAVTYGLRVYTVALGTNGTAPTPVAINPLTRDFVYQNVPVRIDEALLKDIAQATGGQYFRATNNEALAAIYAEIDTLEKTKLQELKFYSYVEYFRTWLLWGAVLLLLEWMLQRTLFRTAV